MRAVNLLPVEAQPARSFRGSGAAVVGAVAVLAVVVVGLGAAFLSAHSHAVSERQQLADAQLQLAQVNAQEQAAAAKATKRAKPIVAVPAVTAEQQPRLDALAQALSQRIAWDRVLREFSLVVPSDITVSSLTMSAPGAHTPAGATTSFSLVGEAYSNDSVARLLSRLALVPDLTGVSLSSSSADPGTGQVSFTVKASVKGAAPVVTAS